MHATTCDGPVRNDASSLRTAIIGRLLQLAGLQVFVGAVLFVSAGTWRWPRAWVYLGLVLFLLAANAVWVLPRNPEIIAERGRRHRGTQRFDRIILPIYSAVGLTTFVVSGLDARFGWKFHPADPATGEDLRPGEDHRIVAGEQRRAGARQRRGGGGAIGRQ